MIVIALPTALASGVMQINLVVGQLVASQYDKAVSWLFAADRLYQLPLGVVGIAVGIVLLPDLSRRLRAGDNDGAQTALSRAAEISLALTIPSAVALMVVPFALVTVLFQRGASGVDDTAAIATAVMIYGLGLPAFVLQKVLQPLFFAREDTATPVKIAALCVVINLGLNLLLMGPLLHVGIALATAISAWINAGLLLFVLRRRGHFKFDDRLRRALPRILLASAAMTAAVGLATDALAGFAAIGAVTRTVALAAVIVIGLAGFAAAAVLFGAARLSDVKGMLDRSSR